MFFLENVTGILDMQIIGSIVPNLCIVEMPEIPQQSLPAVKNVHVRRPESIVSKHVLELQRTKTASSH